jgi:hypothetical protein
VKAQPQCMRVTLLGNLDKTGHKFVSLGLNLSYDGLLLEMWVEGPPRFPQQSFTTHWRLHWNCLINSPSLPMTRFTGWWSYDRGWKPWPVDVVDGGTAGVKRSKAMPQWWHRRCKDVEVSKLEAMRQGTHVDHGLPWHINNCELWRIVMTMWPSTQRDL